MTRKTMSCILLKGTTFAALARNPSEELLEDCAVGGGVLSVRAASPL